MKKKNMEFLHFTRWDLSKININEQYGTDRKLSDYWRRMLKGDWVSVELEDRLSKLPPNIVINEPLRELSKQLIYSSGLLKEYIFEEVRVNKYNELPSRKRCMFLFDSQIDYKDYAKVINFSLEEYNLIEIEVLKDMSKLLRVDMSLLNCNINLYDEIVSKAEEYWSGADKIDLNTEILFEGNFKIKRVILQNVNNGR